MIEQIEGSITSRIAGKAVRIPFATILPEGQEPEPYMDVSCSRARGRPRRVMADEKTSDELLTALKALQLESFVPPACIPIHSAGIFVPEGFREAETFDLSAVSMPPELYDVDEDRWQVGEGQTGNIKLFADDVSSTYHTWDKARSE